MHKYKTTENLEIDEFCARSPSLLFVRDGTSHYSHIYTIVLEPYLLFSTDMHKLLSENLKELSYRDLSFHMTYYGKDDENFPP